MFRLCNTSVTPALGYMELVSRQNTAALLPIIAAHVAPGTTICSDEWSAYKTVATLPGVAGMAWSIALSILSIPRRGYSCTQNIESYWDWAKLKLKRMKGCHPIWMSSCGESAMGRHPTRRSLIFAETLQNNIPCRVQLNTNLLCSTYNKTGEQG